MIQNILSVLGPVLLLISTAPYLIDIVKKKTKPNIVTWITWTMLTAIASVATFAAHEPRTALLTLGSSISTLLVVLLGLRNGIAKFSLFDGFCQAGALVGLLLWLVFDSPLIAIIASVGIDLIGLLPTLRHSWISPQEETWQAFLISVIAVLCTLLSLRTQTLAGVIFPVYLLVADGAVTLIIVYRRKQLGLSL